MGLATGEWMVPPEHSLPRAPLPSSRVPRRCLITPTGVFPRAGSAHPALLATHPFTISAHRLLPT